MFALMRDDLRERGISPMGVHLLQLVREHPDSTLSDLARRGEVTKSHVSTTLEKLEGKGLVERRSDPGDHRLVRFRATAQAAEFFADVSAQIHRHVEDALSRVPESRVEELIEGLEALQMALEPRNRKGDPPS